MDELSQLVAGGVGVTLLWIGYNVWRGMLEKTPKPAQDVTRPLVDLAATLTKTFDTLTVALTSLTGEVREGIDHERTVHSDSASVLTSLVKAANETADILKALKTDIEDTKRMVEDTKSRRTQEEAEALARHSTLDARTREIHATQQQHTLTLDDIKRLAEAIKTTIEKPTPSEEKPNA